MSEKTHYKSRYIVDVIVEQNFVELVDSTHASYYIDIKNKELVKQFEKWFKEIFSKGVN